MSQKALDALVDDKGVELALLSRKREKKRKGGKKKEEKEKGEVEGRRRSLYRLALRASGSIRRAFLCTLQPARRMRKEGERKKEGGSVDERGR